MTTDERINKLAEAMENFERVTRQGFATLTELHADTQKEMGEMQKAMTKLANSMSALADHVADHDVRLDKLDGGK
jgi:predicted negative regulator of RcsB-dependent stress response